MKAHKALQAILFTVILTLGSVLPILVLSPARAEPTSGETTLYFTDALNYLDFESDDFTDFGFTSLSPHKPTKENDSEYPPSLFIDNTTRRFLPKFNEEQFITWFTTAYLLYFLEDSGEFDLDELSEYFGNDTLGDYDIELLFPHPYRIIESYTYEGDESLTITGDFVYNLYFSSHQLLPRFRDDVKIGVYSMNMESLLPLPKLIKNTTKTLTPGLTPKMYNEQLTLTDISYTLNPGDSLLLSIEIVPSNKSIGNILSGLDINKILGRLQNLANRWENKTRLPTLQNISIFINEIILAVNESGVNITSEDFNTFLDAIRSTSFIYDSLQHPSSVTIPAKILTEDIRVYYLHADQSMDETRPTTENSSSIIEITQTPTIWTSEPLTRNKILNTANVTADIYLDYRDFIRLKNIHIIATLYDDNTSIATSDTELDNTNIIETIFKTTSKPITFTFTDINNEIFSGHSLGFGLSVGTDTKLGLRKVKLYYDSTICPSALSANFEETKNIKITEVSSTPENGQIIPGGSLQYLLNISSRHTDTLQITTKEKDKTGSWELSAPASITVTENGWTTIPLWINSTNNLNEAYGNAIDVNIIVTGTTGITSQSISAEVSEDAIDYDVEITGYSKNINISKGENKTFYFVIKNNNTGAIDDVDSYTVTASSEHDWSLIPREHIRDITKGKSTAPEVARVIISAPRNTTIDTDTITITVTSDTNPDATATITITVHVLGGDFFENVYNFFDNIAESLGLNEIFGSLGAVMLVLLIGVIILFILIILALVLTTKPVRIICTDRIKEIETNEQATYDITLQNPRKKPQTYDVSVEQTGLPSKWNVVLDQITTTIDGRQSKNIHLMVTPTEEVTSNEWTKIMVKVKKTGRTKTEHITVMTMIKEGKTLLILGEVTHWPAEFTPGEKITTSFNITNNGTVAARNVNVFFYLNGKQKNKLVVTIPAGSIADVQIPWIAVKGKNQVRIRLKEQ